MAPPLFAVEQVEAHPAFAALLKTLEQHAEVVQSDL